MRDLLRKILRLMVECCALYLFSVLLLLLGVYSAMSSPLLGGTGISGDLPLLAIMGAYDFALLGVLGYLFARPERREDGYYVAMAAILLLMDPTFFTNRVLGYGSTTGLTVNAVCLGLALAKLMILVGWSRVPLARGTRVSLVATLGFVYLAPIPLSFHLVEPAGAYLYLLAWMPLVLAFLAPTPEELVASPDDPTEAARIRAGELRFVAVVLPFVGVGLHLWETASVFGLSLGWMHLGPWMLAALVMLVRMLPEEGEDLVPACVMLAGGSLLACLGSTGAFHVHWLGATATAVRLTLLAHVLVGAYLALRFDSPWLRAYALSAAMLMLAGSTPEEICVRFAGPYGWSAMLFASLAVLRRRREAWVAAVVAISASGLVSSLATGTPASALFVHLAGISLVALTHVFPEQEERFGAVATVITWGLLALSARAGLGTGATEWTVVFGIEAALVCLGAATTTLPRYRLAVAGGAAAVLWRSPLVAWVQAHRTGLGLAGSFLFLAGGFWASAHKQSLLASLSAPEGDGGADDVEEAEADGGPEPELEATDLEPATAASA